MCKALEVYLRLLVRCFVVTALWRLKLQQLFLRGSVSGCLGRVCLAQVLERRSRVGAAQYFKELLAFSLATAL